MSGSGKRDRWAHLGACDAAIVAAVSEQRRFVMGLLGSRRWEAEDVLAQVALDMVSSMPRWATLPQRPALGAWARGVAVRTFYAWTRGPGTGHGPGGTSMVSTELLAEQGVSLPSPATDLQESRHGVHAMLVQRLRETVMAQPGGAATWDALVGEDGRVRGKTAAAQLRLLLEVADPTGSLRRTAGLMARGATRGVGASNAA